MHCVITTSTSSQYVSGTALSQGSSYHTSNAPVVWVSHGSVWHLRTCCLNLDINSSSKLKLCHWWLLFFSPTVFPENQKQQHKKGMGRKRKETSSALLTNCHSYKIFLSSSLLPTLLLKALGAGIKMDTAFLQHWPRENSDLFRYTVQSIFPSIPFRFASDPVCSVPAVFPQVSNITETKKNSLLSSSSDTTSWNNPFLVNEKTTSTFQPDPTFNVLLPLF